MTKTHQSEDFKRTMGLYLEDVNNSGIMMAMGYGCRDEYYNITFKASIPSENMVIFQTKACFILHRPYQIAEIKFVREFNSKGREYESIVFGKDPEKLPFISLSWLLRSITFTSYLVAALPWSRMTCMAV
ncbi:hypothetical protein POM88_052077 [Heracleum sosnowskyi]|uniref:Uncharacterized protein n=1 Tax=Heracleum sosnowskyi TaxID=360622 RepID=A0AAD8GST9_9APIA|nr:hypothetical protein POM88_052077 [Heracleum sosnowskyi]